MHEIERIFFKLIEDRGLIDVAVMMEHQSTSIIERWYKEGKIPNGKRFQVQEVLKAQGLINV